MTIAAGTRLGTYEITALLGAGGMGEVYRARDGRLGRDVALKVLAPRLYGNRDAVSRFEQEARSASALSHPHILHIYDIGTAEVEGEPLRFMTMELVDGATLSAKIRESAELTDLLGWLVQVADGLAKAHNAGIVHRDLKPENVMITRDGYAKILDFGLAKLVERPVDAEAATMVGGAPHSVPGLIVGTAAYMSPEQAQGKPLDARTDVFAFGCILFEAAARRRAFDGSSLVDTMHKVVHGEPDFGGLDPRIARIARKCLAKDPSARYDSIRDVARDLRAVANPQPATAAAKDDNKTIAVLPFDDLSPTRDNDYFAEGVAEEITSDLSKVRSLRVISRSSARKYRGEEKDIARVAADLGAAFVIDGSVRKAGNQLRVTAQLIETATLTQLWSDKYSGTIDEVFDIQEKVARAVVERLQVELTSSENARLGDRTMSNVEAYDCYLRARRLILRFDEEGLTAALKEIERGIAIAGPNPALLGAQGTVYWQYYNLAIHPETSYLDRAEAIAKVILDADASSLHGLRLMGLVAIQRQQLRVGIDYFDRVLAIDPNDIDALLWSIFIRSIVGRETKSLVDRLVAVDPLSSITWAMQALEPFVNGRIDDALAMIARARAIEDAPMFSVIELHFHLSSGRLDRAKAMLPQVAKSLEGTIFANTARALVHAASGEREEAKALLTEEVLHASRGDLQYSAWIADVYALIGEHDLALDWLGNAIDRGWISWPLLSQHHRLLDPLRGDPRFDALLERARVEWLSFQ